jgi:hypothetical protein
MYGEFPAKNQSFIKGPNVIEKVEALKFWSRATGRIPIAVNPLIEFDTAANYSGTLTLSGIIDRAANWGRLQEEAERHFLPLERYIGSDIYHAVSFIGKVCDRLRYIDEELSGRGKARGSWLVRPKSEYEWQDLIYIVLKPWLPGIGRENVAVVYDKQENRSDFSLFRDRLIIEVKYIRNSNEKAAVLKTLSGLTELYSKNANVQMILFVIFAERSAAIDANKWTADFFQPYFVAKRDGAGSKFIVSRYVQIGT